MKNEKQGRLSIIIGNNIDARSIYVREKEKCIFLNTPKRFKFYITSKNAQNLDTIISGILSFSILFSAVTCPGGNGFGSISVRLGPTNQ